MEFSSPDSQNIWKSHEEEEEERRRREAEARSQPESQPDEEESWLKKLEQQLNAAREARERKEEQDLEQESSENNADNNATDLTDRSAEYDNENVHETPVEVEPEGTEAVPEQVAATEETDLATETEKARLVTEVLPTDETSSDTSVTEIKQKVLVDAAPEEPPHTSPEPPAEISDETADEDEQEVAPEISLPSPEIEKDTADEADMLPTYAPTSGAGSGVGSSRNGGNGGTGTGSGSAGGGSGHGGGSGSGYGSSSSGTGAGIRHRASSGSGSSGGSGGSSSVAATSRPPSAAAPNSVPQAPERSRNRFGEGLVVGGLLTWLYQRHKRNEIIGDLKAKHKKETVSVEREISVLADRPPVHIIETIVQEKEPDPETPAAVPLFKRFDSLASENTHTEAIGGENPLQSPLKRRDGTVESTLHTMSIQNTEIDVTARKKLERVAVDIPVPFSAYRELPKEPPAPPSLESSLPMQEHGKTAQDLHRRISETTKPAAVERLHEYHVRQMEKQTSASKEQLPTVSPEFVPFGTVSKTARSTSEHPKPLTRGERIIAESPEFDLGLRRQLRQRQAAWRAADSEGSIDNRSVPRAAGGQPLLQPTGRHQPDAKIQDTATAGAGSRTTANVTLAVIIALALAFTLLWLLVR